MPIHGNEYKLTLVELINYSTMDMYLQLYTLRKNILMYVRYACTLVHVDVPYSRKCAYSGMSLNMCTHSGAYLIRSCKPPRVA